MDSFFSWNFPKPVRWPLPNALASAEDQKIRCFKHEIWMMNWGKSIRWCVWWCFLINVMWSKWFCFWNYIVWFDMNLDAGLVKHFNAISFKPHQRVTWGTCGESKPTNPPSNDSGAHGIVAEESKMQHPFSWNWDSKMQVRCKSSTKASQVEKVSCSKKE